MSDDDVRSYFETYYPLVEPGAEPPPQKVPDPENPGGEKWSGFHGWRRRHGSAIAAYSHDGHPCWVWLARYPDGSRGEVQASNGIWRRGLDGRGWVYGRLDIGPDDAVFTDGEQPPTYLPPPLTDEPNLEAELARDPAFLAAIQDDRFARAVYTVFQNRTFYRGSDERDWGLGGPRTGELVANLRGLGEHYLDYYPEGGELPGFWPDDVVERKQSIARLVEIYSRPLLAPDFKFTGPTKVHIGERQYDVENEKQAAEVEELLREQFEADRADMEESRQGRLNFLRKQFAEIENGQNADVFVALHAHVTRVGWRTETEADRRRAHDRKVAAGLAIVREIEILEQRPTAAPESWSDPIATKRAHSSPRDGASAAMVLNRPPTKEEGVLASSDLSRRIGMLALTGRVTESEYRSLWSRSGPYRDMEGTIYFSCSG